jgi:prepilin-type N-terminal cleavage/methylation domain-containing protein
MNKKGFTLLEILLTASIIGAIVLAITHLGFPLIKFFQQSRSRQQANTEARICLETMERVLSNGKASTLVISNSPTIPPMQSGRAQFQTMEGSSYTITWSSGPANSVHLLRTPLGGTVAVDTMLATHVTELSFLWDMSDPAILTVTLQMTVPLDSSGSPDSFLTIMLPPLTTRLIGS